MGHEGTCMPGAMAGQGLCLGQQEAAECVLSRVGGKWGGSGLRLASDWKGLTEDMRAGHVKARGW